MSVALSRQPTVWTAPLVPVALAMTAGIVLDRYCILPLAVSVVGALASLLAWLIFNNSTHRLSLVYLGSGALMFGAAYHHWYRYHLDPDDISHEADYEGLPARLVGIVNSAPVTQIGPAQSSFPNFPSKTTTRFVLSVAKRQVVASRNWKNVSGQVQVTLRREARTAGEKKSDIDDITVGDEVEVLGRLALPGEAMNAGGFDYASFLRDQGITATLTVLESDEIILLRQGWPMSPFGWLAVVRGWGNAACQSFGRQQAIAAALLLGEATAMTGEQWDKYQRTGVVHVLAISGQHLVVLAGFLWLLARAMRIRRRHAAIVVALILISYALLAGGRPPVMRAAAAVAVFSGAILLRRSVSHANTFDLAWILVAFLNPTDVFNAGCQLSFLAVAVLIWGGGHRPFSVEQRGTNPSPRIAFLACPASAALVVPEQ